MRTVTSFGIYHFGRRETKIVWKLNIMYHFKNSVDSIKLMKSCCQEHSRLHTPDSKMEGAAYCPKTKTTGYKLTFVLCLSVSTDWSFFF